MLPTINAINKTNNIAQLAITVFVCSKLFSLFNFKSRINITSNKIPTVIDTPIIISGNTSTSLETSYKTICSPPLVAFCISQLNMSITNCCPIDGVFSNPNGSK